MQLYFIRHAQSQNNALWLDTGSEDSRNEDPDLTPKGERQAEMVAAYLRDYRSQGWSLPWDPRNETGFKLTHVYCSLMLRAVRTGSAIAQALGLPLFAWEDLHENGGIYLENMDTGERVGLPGKDRLYFETHYPHLRLPETMNAKGWWNRAFEEEALRRERAARVLGMLRERHGGTDDRVAVITHGGFYNTLLKTLLNMPVEDSLWFSLVNTGITRLDFGIESSVVYANRSDHLPAELIT